MGNLHRDKDPEAPKTKDKYAAYQSVGIYLAACPPESILNLVKERARTFNQRPDQFEWAGAVTVTGFRLKSFPAGKKDRGIVGYVRR